MSKKPTDPNLTIDVKNDQLVALIESYKKQPGNDTINALINHLVNCRVLVPGMPGPNNQPQIQGFLQKDGTMIQPIFTDKTQLEGPVKPQAVINMPYLVINQIVSTQMEKSIGIVINPFTQNCVFTKQMVDSIEEQRPRVEAALKNKGVQMNTSDGTATQGMELSEQQIVAKEAAAFAQTFLPKKFFENTAAFLKSLQERREEQLDALYEESYENPRMYPYLPEDFRLTPMSISDTLLMLTVEMPKNNGMPGAANDLYFLYDSASAHAKYFAVINGSRQSENLLEVFADSRVVDHGTAPESGKRLQMILDMFGEE